MPPQGLPERAKEVYLSAEASAKKSCPEGDRHEECIARKAWAAVKRGWKKEGEKWVPKSTAEFSLFINKASLNKKTQEMHWYAVASDIEPDSYNDEMSLELYSDFEKRIETKELPPESHRSDYWQGGMPYLSVSHYLDLNGFAVPGPTDNVYVDGKCLKSNGRFDNTVLGKACFDAICKDLYGEEKSENEDKIRISIAFIDWGHEHKSNGYEFNRKSLDEICPECLKEQFIGGEGKIFRKGHLIHLALTRVPVNERTSMEVRSMPTQKQDSESIVGEELAEMIEERKDELQLEGKADLVIKADQEDETPEAIVEESKHEMGEEDEEDKDKKKKDKEEKADLVEEPVAHVLEPAVSQFLSDYDEIFVANASYKEKLQAVQVAFENLGEAVKSSFAPTEDDRNQETLDEIKGMLTQLLSRQDATEQELAILKQKSLTANPKESISQPVRRSLELDPGKVFGLPAQDGAPRSVREIARSTVGLRN
ncbi:MAG: hypothetical protein ACXAAP_12585 [Candidatus Thorarchaeota archaeon]|jgi:hypothetical protein